MRPLSLRAARTAVASALLATVLLAPPPASASAAAAPVCNGSAAPTFGTASPYTSLNSSFTTYGNSNARLDDWTGADSTYSVKLPDGRTVFGFSDTFLGQVNNGTRPLTIADGGTTPFPNNTFVVRTASGTMTTAHGGTTANPTALLPPRDSSHLYWAADMTVNGSEVQQPYREYWVGGAWNLKFERNVLARFATSNLNQPVSVTDLPSSRQIMWGSALLRDGGYTYIYGTEDLGTAGKHLYIARVSGTDLRGTWYYRTSSGDFDSTSEAAAVRMLSGVSNEFSVSKRGNFYILLTQDTKDAFSTEIDTYLSCSPGGPFTDEKTVYRTPETGAGNPNIYTYNAHAHASMTTSNNIVVSYNVNSLDTTVGTENDNYKNVSIYRPRFINLPVSG
ncbi:DUF5005 domain-containing protein [Spirillospora sp. NPDC048911]|uniref:DUF5005 domain-containing protein n=1 Tax=Spirillospora sp. NPDC048911 TaxID=3364527 RepID=UPI00371866B3